MSTHGHMHGTILVTVHCLLAVYHNVPFMNYVCAYKPDQNCEHLYSEILASCKLQ